MKRKRLTKKGSRRLFRVTGDKVHTLNMKIDGLSRGGIRL